MSEITLLIMSIIYRIKWLVSFYWRPKMRGIYPYCSVLPSDNYTSVACSGMGHSKNKYCPLMLHCFTHVLKSLFNEVNSAHMIRVYYTCLFNHFLYVGNLTLRKRFMFLSILYVFFIQLKLVYIFVTHIFLLWRSLCNTITFVALSL